MSTLAQKTRALKAQLASDLVEAVSQFERHSDYNGYRLVVSRVGTLEMMIKATPLEGNHIPVYFRLKLSEMF